MLWRHANVTNDVTRYEIATWSVAKSVTSLWTTWPTDYNTQVNGTPITCLLILNKVGRIHQPRTSNHRLQSRKVEWLTVSRYFLERNTNLFFLSFFISLLQDRLSQDILLRRNTKRFFFFTIFQAWRRRREAMDYCPKHLFSQTAVRGEKQFIRKFFWDKKLKVTWK